jgi:hypothetical protein
MPRRLVNAEAFMYTRPNPVAGQPPLGAAAHFGAVIDLSDEEAAKGDALQIPRDYPIGKDTVRRMEPALLPADASLDPATSGAEAARAFRRATLLRELDALGGEVAEVPLLPVDVEGLAPNAEDAQDAEAPTAPPGPPELPTSGTKPSRSSK